MLTEQKPKVSFSSEGNSIMGKKDLFYTLVIFIVLAVF